MKILLSAFIILWLNSLGLSYTISLLPFFSTQPYINANNEPTFRCGPASIGGQAACNSNTAQFRHNNSVINTSSSKYELDTFYDHASLTVHNVVPSDGGCYGCSYICNGTIVNADNVCLTFIPPIVFLVPDNAVYYSFVGSNATLLCDAQHYSNLQWQTASGIVIQSSHKYSFQGNNLVINDITVSDQKSYICAANNDITHKTIITARLQVYMKPVVTAVGNSSVSVYEGNTTTFVCQARAVPRPSIVWANENNIHIGDRIQSNEVNIGNDTVLSTLTISSTEKADRGPYKCTGATDNGTSTVTFHLNVKNIPVPSLQLHQLNFSSNSITVRWEVFGVPESESITISWRLAGPQNVTLGKRNVSQSSFSLSVSSLLPNTTYIFTATLLELVDSVIITTDPEEYSSSPSPSIVKMSPSSVSSVVTGSLSPLISFPKPTIDMYSSSLDTIPSTPTPTQLSIPNRNNQPLGTVVGLVLGSILLILIIVVFVAAGFCLLHRKERRKTSLNVQSIDKQITVRSDCNLLEYPKRNGLSLSSLNSPYHGNDIEVQAMTPNPQFMDETISGRPGLSQDSVSVYNTCSSCPPVNGRATENVYYVDSEDNFEMTDNPYFDFDKVKVDLDSASQIYYAESENYDNRFEYSNNSNYESCLPPPPPFAVYDSNLSLSRTQSPRFQIVSEKRGDVREKVDLVHQYN
ncbi:PREDICTED: hemicentin-1-like [Amphimedon queenslandica]|uniref:Uncharacterized protein n=1 Tax=Amphimedon queenslandica TaxID=400682 RepID=A0A1X7VJ96_AMPQE|nr:PREDICTED: hemicentin-1-like [Amphimedon queenslandica]|eukprot:XP_019848682.1 PREDICTED: hemicentin-1-like [Amphimedon queenslandica]